MIVDEFLKTAAILLMLAFMSQNLCAGDNRWRVSDNEMISIEATEAWEDTEPDIVHFAGNFRLEAGSWSLKAEKATVYGKLDRPDSVILSGAPAVIELQVENDSQTQIVLGEAPHIEYLRAQHSIRMSGGSMLSRSGNVMTSSEIVYDIETDRFSAGGPEGVQIRVETED